jgi:hypothetical protein
MTGAESFETTGHLSWRKHTRRYRPEMIPVPPRRPTMSRTLSLSLAAALALSAVGGVPRAYANPTSSDESDASSSYPTNDEINALEIGNPHSVDYRNRAVPRRSPTSDEINAAETLDPNSVDSKDQRSTSKDLKPASESASQQKP